MKNLALIYHAMLFVIFISIGCDNTENSANPYSAIDTKTLSSQLAQSSLRRAQSLPPVGLMNRGSDCYFSTALQLVLNHPSFVEAALKAGEKQPLYRELVEEYHNAQKDNKEIDTDSASAYRKFRKYLNEKTGGKFPENTQRDASHAVQAIIVDIVSFGSASPFRVALKDLSTQKNYFEDWVVYAGVDGKQLDVVGGLGKAYLKDFKGSDGRLYKQYLALPSNLLFEGNISPSQQLFSLTLPKELLIQPPREEAEYVLNYISFHFGGIGFGHYFAWLKIQGTWYEANDGSVTTIGNDDAAKAKFDAVTKSSCTIRMLSYSKK